MNTFVMQQEKVHFQALAQGDDETTLRIYFLRTPEITAVITPGAFATSITETTAARNQFAPTLNNQGPPSLLLSAPVNPTFFIL